MKTMETKNRVLVLIELFEKKEPIEKVLIYLYNKFAFYLENLNKDSEHEFIKNYNRLAKSYNEYRKFIFETPEYEWGKDFFYYEFNKTTWYEFIGNLILRLQEDWYYYYPSERIGIGGYLDGWTPYNIRIISNIGLFELKENSNNKGGMHVLTPTVPNNFTEYMRACDEKILGVGDMCLEIHEIGFRISENEIKAYKKSYYETDKRHRQEELHLILSELKNVLLTQGLSKEEEKKLDLVIEKSRKKNRELRKSIGECVWEVKKRSRDLYRKKTDYID